MSEIKRIIRPANIEVIYNAEISGNPEDQGRWKSLIDKEKGSKDIALGIGWLGPGEVHLLHHHEKASEFYYILEGTGIITVADEAAKVGPGTATYIPAGEKHKIENDATTDLVVLFGYNRVDWESIWDE